MSNETTTTTDIAGKKWERGSDCVHRDLRRLDERQSERERGSKLLAKCLAPKERERERGREWETFSVNESTSVGTVGKKQENRWPTTIAGDEEWVQAAGSGRRSSSSNGSTRKREIWDEFICQSWWCSVFQCSGTDSTSSRLAWLNFSGTLSCLLAKKGKRRKGKAIVL